ncbi:hypothetical protein WNZ15_22880 [Roseibium sp. AS2]|uniref:hypothetical protein n=1 Tax=Roseibium sp. AS2 TaxID=3135781 RepID=UPI00318180FA
MDMKTHGAGPIRVRVPAQFQPTLGSFKRMEAPMAHGKTETQTHTTRHATFPQALMFMLAVSILMLMSAFEPRLAMPLAAFAVMASLTWLLGQRLFQQLTGATGRPD